MVSSFLVCGRPFFANATPVHNKMVSTKLFMIYSEQPLRKEYAIHKQRSPFHQVSVVTYAPNLA
jgi:hypothetical protein